LLFGQQQQQQQQQQGQQRGGGGSSFTSWAPCMTTFGFTNGVSTVMSRCYQEEMLPKHPANPREDCCYWSFGMATTESLKHDLGCCFYFFGYLLLRLMLACLVMPLFAAGMTIVSVIMIFPTLWYFYSQFGASGNIGIVAKLCFFIGFLPVAFASPATVCLASVWHGFFIPFQYCMKDSFMFLHAGPITYLTTGLGLRERAFNEYNQHPVTWEYEVKIFAPFTLLLGVVFGAAFGVSVFALLSVLLAPKYFYMSLCNLWKINPNPLGDQQLPVAQQTGVERYDNDVCIQLCRCMWNSTNDLCSICTFFFKLIWSFVVLVGVVLFIPYSVVYGLWVCTIAGAGAWENPTSIWRGPIAEVNQWLDTTKKQIESNTFGM